MSDKIKVLHVVGRMDRGGTEALLMNLLRTLDTDKFQYDFVEQTKDKCDYDDEIHSLGSKIYRCPHISAKNLRRYRAWWRTFFKKHPEYKIVHGHSRGSGPIYLDEAKKAGRITIAHCHNNSYGRGIQGFVRHVWQLPLRKIADYNLACSYDSGVSQYGKNAEFEVIKNGIQTEKFFWNLKVRDKLRSEYHLEDKLVIGNVARFVDQKNHVFLIHIFQKILQEKPNSILLLIGEGPEEPTIHKLALKLGVEDNIIYLGVRTDVNEWMQAMDIFILPSIFEGLGIVNIEAQAAGLPTFTSDKVVAPEVAITDLLHFIPLTDSAEKWANYILAHRIDLSDRRDTSQEIVEAGFDILSTAKKLENFYEQLSYIKSENTPTISIVTPTYNRVHLINNCFESLLRQTDKDFEWIIIDDGSTDSTEEIVSEFQADFPIYYVKKENGGKHTALNKSHDYIHGNYVCIVDSDDYLIDSAISKMKDGWKKYGSSKNIGIIILLKGSSVDSPSCMAYEKDEGKPVDIMRYQRKYIHSGDACEVIRADLFKKYPFPVFEGEKFVSEGALWNRVSFTHKCVYINEVVYIADYLEGGLTKSGRHLRVHNPNGGMYTANLNMNKKNFFKLRLKNGLLFTCYGFFAKKNILTMAKQCDSKILVWLCMPFGYALYRYWKKKYY